MAMEPGERRACFSPNRAYRYALWRTWDDDAPALNVVSLNPSTADEHTDDPTIRRCIGLAQRVGCGKLVVTNLFAWCATEPALLKRATDPVGPENDAWLQATAATSDYVLAAWGMHGAFLGREAAVHRLLSGTPLLCLGQTKGGQPRHPLYLPSAEQLRPYVP